MVITKSDSSLLALIFFFSINSAIAFNIQLYIDSIDIPANIVNSCANSSKLLLLIASSYSTNGTIEYSNRTEPLNCYEAVRNQQDTPKIIAVSDIRPAVRISGIECNSSLSIAITLQFNGSEFTLQSSWKDGSDAFADQRRITTKIFQKFQFTSIFQNLPSSKLTDSSPTASLLTVPTADNRYVTFHWGLSIDNGTCNSENTTIDNGIKKSTESSTPCLVEFIVIGIESGALALIFIIGLCFFVRSRGLCDCSSIVNKSRGTPPPQVIKVDSTWNSDDYLTHRNGGNIGTTNFSNFQPSHTVNMPGRSDTLPPSTSNARTNNVKQRPPSGLLGKPNKNKLPPPLPAKDFGQEEIYNTIQDGGWHQQEHQQHVEPDDDWKEDYEDVDDKNRSNQTYDDAVDLNNRRRH